MLVELGWPVDVYVGVGVGGEVAVAVRVTVAVRMMVAVGGTIAVIVEVGAFPATASNRKCEIKEYPVCAVEEPIRMRRIDDVKVKVFGTFWLGQSARESTVP